MDELDNKTNLTKSGDYENPFKIPMPRMDVIKITSFLDDGTESIEVIRKEDAD